MKEMTLRASVAVATLAGVLPAVAAPSYVNDFSRRASSGPIATGAWHELAYGVGQLAHNHRSPDNPSAAYSQPGNMQDTWIKAYLSQETTSGTAEVVAEADGNQYVRFRTPAPGSADICPAMAVLQPFYNSISNGILRISTDLRAPLWWLKGGTGYIRVQPLFRCNLQNPNWSSMVTCANWGLQKPDGKKDTDWDDSRFTHYFGNGSGGGGDAVQYMGSPRLSPTHWHRFVMELNLETGALNGKVYDMGDSHPALNAPNGTCLQTFPGKTVLNKVSATTGPIEGIAVRLSYFAAKEDVATHYPSCDNFVCSWKAPGSDTFEPFYENDFSVRRYRTLSPAGTATHDYVRTVATRSETYTGYAALTSSTTTNQSWLVDSTKGLVSLGGWRRRAGGDDNLAIVKMDGNPMLQISRRTGNGDFACAMQTLGERVTNGKVRLAFDFRTPDQWYYRYASAYGALGPASSYAGETTYYAACTGVGSTAADARFYLYRFQNGTAAADTTKACRADTWYRCFLTVDLDGRTYDSELYEIGANPVAPDWTPAAPALYVLTGLPLRADIQDISTVMLFGYGAGPNTTAAVPHLKHVYFDNVKVWKDWTGSGGTLIYQDTFDACTRTFTAARGRAAGTLHRDDGEDHWILRQEGRGETWITDGENPAFAATSGNDYSLAVQEIGKAVSGRFTCAADIRPPLYWTYSGARSATVRLGGDAYFQGNMGTAGGAERGVSQFALSFGFGDSKGTKSYGAYRTVNFMASRGGRDGTSADLYGTAVVDPSHWYRFVVKGDATAGTYDLDVYDMGATHPTASSPAGGLVQSWTGLGFRHVFTEGLTSLGLATYGNPMITASDPADPGLALYDNLRVSTPQGLVLEVR